MKLVTGVVQSFHVAKVFQENTDRVNSMDFTDDGKHLISSSDDDSIVIYDCEKGTHKRSLNSRKYGCDLVRFTHNDNAAVHISNKIDDTIRYLSLHDNKYIRYFCGHTRKVVSLNVSPVDDTFLSGSLDDSVRLWDLRSPNCQGCMLLSGRPVATFDPEGVIFAVALSNEMINLYDLRSFDKGPFNSFTIPKSNKDYEWTGIKFSPDGRYLLISTNGHSLYLLDAFQGILQQTFTGFTNAKSVPLEASFSPDSQFIFHGSTNGIIHVWNADSGVKTASLHCESKGPITCVQFSPKYMMLVSACSDVAFWLPSLHEDKL